MRNGLANAAAAILLAGGMVADHGATATQPVIAPTVQTMPTTKHQRGQPPRRRFKGWQGNPPKQAFRDLFLAQMERDLIKSIGRGDATLATVQQGYSYGDAIPRPVREAWDRRAAWLSA